MSIVKLNNVWEMYRIKFIEQGRSVWENYWALKDVSFEVKKGETLGLIGENGSGKSTVLKLIVGMLKADRGEVTANGRVSGLLELGVGFEYEMTGKDNVYALASLYGLTKKQIGERFANIVDFANIGRFINAPVKSYSSGMFVRLAFALAIHVDPEILVIDDVLAVGDEFFQRKCIKKIFELKDQGKTILFVTHDMNMLRRLCKRVILLKDGRVVKDGLVEKVIPLYTQMVGSKKGVGVIESKPLNIVFNNGKLFINWNDKLLTFNSGGYASFRMGDKWYNSFQADWEVQKQDGKELIVSGKLHQLSLVQVWKIKLINSSEIKLDIEMQSEGSFEIQEGCTNIMLSNEYSQWFTPLEKGSFPVINEQSMQWHSILEGSASRQSIGVRPDSESSGVVSLVVEDSSHIKHSYSQIWNTDYFNNCRVLQYKKVGLKNYKGHQGNNFNYFSGKILLNIKDTNSYIDSLKDNLSLFAGKLRLQFNKGQCLVYWGGTSLTRANNINSSIYANGFWYFSEFAYWNFEKKSETKLIAKGSWSSIPVSQIWEIEIKNENSFTIKLYLEINGEVSIREQYIQLECLEGYEAYYSKYGEDNFPDAFLESNIDMVQRCIAEGEVGFISKNSELPNLEINFSKELSNFVKIFNSDMSARARTLCIERVEPEANMKFSEGKHLCFNVSVGLENNKRIAVKKKFKKELIAKNLRFNFNKGIGRLYVNGLEITKRLGIYTSLRHEGSWYDSSSQAIWTVKDSRDGVDCFGKWVNLPISQKWSFNLKDDSSISFKVLMIIDKKIKFERLQTNVMLSERYSFWFSANGRGEFPLFKGDISSDWDVIKAEKADSKFIGVYAKSEGRDNLPVVKFMANGLAKDWHFNIINSDLYHRGRVLQYLKSSKESFMPGEYLYYDGEIVIGED